jgi:hypothetical protein
MVVQEFWTIAHLRDAFKWYPRVRKKQVWEGTSRIFHCRFPYRSIQHFVFGSCAPALSNCFTNIDCFLQCSKTKFSLTCVFRWFGMSKIDSCFVFILWLNRNEISLIILQCDRLAWTVLHSWNAVKMNIGHPVSKSKFRTLVKVNLGRRTLRWL